MSAVLKQAQREASIIADVLLKRQKQNKIDLYYPKTGNLSRDKYVKHMECFAAGKITPFRCVMGANRCGKSEGIGAYETALHLTGDYPDWWVGHRYGRPIRALCVASDADQLRKSVQRKLFGSEWGEGMIRGALLPREEARAWSGATGVYRYAKVKCKFGGFSELWFGTYDQGREAFEAFEIDWVWEDEEPPQDIHGEILIRTMKSDQLDIIESDARVIYTYTPIKGMTDLTMSVLEKQAANDPGVHVTNITWDDVPHLSETAKALILSECPKFMRDARSKGIPVAGEGRIYQIEESRIICDPFQIPKHYKWVFGFDVGFYHTAAVFLAIDCDNDNWYAVEDYDDGGLDEVSGEVIDYTIHATRIKARSMALAGFVMPGVGDCAELDKRSGKSYQALYKECGLDITLANKGIDAGLTAVQAKFANGTLKIFNTPKTAGLRKEINQYSQEKGKPIKLNNHRPDGLRYGVLSGKLVAKNKSVGKVTFQEHSVGY